MLPEGPYRDSGYCTQERVRHLDHSYSSPQGGQDPLAGLGQRSSGRLQVLIVIVGGQDLDRVGQGRA